MPTPTPKAHRPLTVAGTTAVAQVTAAMAAEATTLHLVEATEGEEEVGATEEEVEAMEVEGAGMEAPPSFQRSHRSQPTWATSPRRLSREILMPSLKI